MTIMDHYSIALKSTNLNFSPTLLDCEEFLSISQPLNGNRILGLLYSQVYVSSTELHIRGGEIINPLANAL